jgi:hypothetical protein
MAPLPYDNRHQGSFIIPTVARSIAPTIIGNFSKTMAFWLRSMSGKGNCYDCDYVAAA